MPQGTSPLVNNSRIDIIRAVYKPLGSVIPFSGPHIFLFCRGETIADVFPDWIERCELNSPFTYMPFDLNMPISIPRRDDMCLACSVDPPLSEIGKICTQMLARDLVARNADTVTAIYTAPTLASLQTSFEIAHYLKGRYASIPIRINADLTSNRSGVSHWLSEHQLRALGYNIDEEYKPLVSMESPETLENLDSITAILKDFIKGVADLSGNVIVVADSLIVKSISDVVNGISRAYTNLQVANEEAEKSFPPGSTATIDVLQFSNEIILEMSPLNIRPITAISMSTTQNKEHDLPFF